MADDTAGAPATTDTSTSPAAAPAELTIAELQLWLRQWVANATGQSIDAITVDRPMEEFGLASRDAIALVGDIEDRTGVTLTPTVYYQHPSIASLAQWLVEGDPEVDEADDTAYYLSGGHGREDDIAIVGLSTRLPGAGDTPESTWEFILNRGDGISELPAGRWSEFTSDPEIAAEVAKHHNRGGYLAQDVVKSFDAEFFAMSPLEVERVDPQQRLMMELTWEALEHARIPASELKGGNVGVFVGTSTNDFMLITTLGIGADPDEPVSAAAYGLTGNSTAIIANRLSYFFDFRGPSVAVDTACSSTIVAVHQAVRALRGGEADVALAGGVNMLLAPIGLGFDSVGGVAKDGHVKAFASDADGMVRSEGAGMVVLKRLTDAERDGDTVLAVVKGSAVNSDGRSNGLVAPNPVAQADVLRRAYRDAGVLPSTVDYIEAHGTGTPLGDPIEADALGKVVGRGRDEDKPALLGSVKTNFGHLESAAGAASLAKVVMSFQHNVIAPNINFSGPSPYIPFDQARLRVVEEPTEFPRYSGTATVGISGFGWGGTNAHLVLQEYVPPVPAEAETADTADATDESAAAKPAPQSRLSADTGLVVLAVSAHVPSRRRKAAERLADWLESGPGRAASLVDVGRSLARRSHGRSRAVVVAATHDEAVAGLRAAAAGKQHPAVFTSDAPPAQGPVWVLSGFGAQHRKMAKQLYQDNAVFAATVDEVDALVEFEAGYSVKELFLDDAQDYDVGTSQVAIFTIQLGLAALLRYHGSEPAAVVGHSLGEVAGAYLAGGLNLDDAVRVICARSRLMGEAEAALTGDAIWRMALLEYSAEEIAKAIEDSPELEIAVYASPQHTVVGGPEAQVQAMAARAEAAGKMARVLQTKGAGHTSQTDVLLGELSAELAGLEPGRLTAGVFSTVHALGSFPAGGDPIHDVDYWVKNMRHAVWFTQAVGLAVAAGHTTFVELNANPVALVSVAATTFGAGLHDAKLIQTLKRKEDEPRGVVMALAQLFGAGHSVDLTKLFGAGDYADIPRTEFQRKQFWPKVRSAAARSTGNRMTIPAGSSFRVVPTADGGFEVVVEAGTVVEPTAGAAPADVRPSDSVDEGPVPDTAVAVAAAEGKWNPDSGVSAEDRLAEIVAESMGYAVEDLPREIPLVELGLDSLMAMRIKNRVEYEFDIPPLQLQAVASATLIDVAKYLQYAVEHRDEVQALYDQQQAEKDAAAPAAAPEAAPAVEAPAAKSVVEKVAPEDDSTADVPPRDPAERLAFATWATVTGQSAKGIFNPLPTLSDDKAAQLAQRLSERAAGEIAVADVVGCANIEQLADLVRVHLEGGSLDGFVRTLRQGDPGRTPLFLFHPAGSTSLAYEPLLRRLPEQTPVYGFERVEGSLEDRAREYLPKVREIQPEGPYVLAGWSLGGALALLVGRELRALGHDVRFVGLIDTVLSADPPEEDTLETRKARILRFQDFAKRTYNIDGELDEEQLEELAEAEDEEQIAIVMQLVEFSGVKIPGGMVEHQKHSYIDNMALFRTDPTRYSYDGDVVLYLGDRYHDGAIELEPRMANRAPNGGWDQAIANLEVVYIGGDHVQIVDEPYIAAIGADLTRKLAELAEPGQRLAQAQAR
ncbi:MAG: acyltransferase domain-containing protein [Mycobacteriaceae bacterium]|nr:acyltransferase domain-containing protein [Mycobacteriaceae bacterium]